MQIIKITLAESLREQLSGHKRHPQQITNNSRQENEAMKEREGG